MSAGPSETWTRRWDGLDSDILIAQRHRDDDALALIRGLLPAFADRRYVRIDGEPLLLVYCADAIPDPSRWAAIWRGAAREAGYPDIDLALVQSVNQTTMDPSTIGYDAAVEFPPHLTRSQGIAPDPNGVRRGFQGDVLDYVSCAQNALARPRPDYRLFRGVMTGWDNTARVPDIARCFVNAEPANYERWLAAAAAQTREWHDGDERIVFVNAWNEWAEGCHLERSALRKPFSRRLVARWAERSRPCPILIPAGRLIARSSARMTLRRARFGSACRTIRN